MGSCSETLAATKGSNLLLLQLHVSSRMGGEERESWGNHCEFFLSSLGLAVGLGNVWRFPYVAYQNGGGSFLIPYLVMLLLVGLPAFFVELTAGQYARVGANKVWGRMVPAFKGLGYGMLLVRFYVNIYYVVICSWAFYYLAMGFRKDLLWQYCGSLDDNTKGCYSEFYLSNCNEKHGKDPKDPWTYYAGECTKSSEFCQLFDGASYTNGEICQMRTGVEKTFSELSKRVSPAEDFYNRVVLGLAYNFEGDQYTWEEFGPLKWELVLCLARVDKAPSADCCWLLSFLFPSRT